MSKIDYLVFNMFYKKYKAIGSQRVSNNYIVHLVAFLFIAPHLLLLLKVGIQYLFESEDVDVLVVYL